MKKALILILTLSLLLGGCAAPGQQAEMQTTTETAPPAIQDAAEAIPQEPVDPVVLEIDTTYDAYDLTGDGVADTLAITCLQPWEDLDWGDYGYHWQFLVNGEGALELESDWPIRPETALYQVSPDRVYLAISQRLDTNDDIAGYGLYRYAGGKLEQVCDFYCDSIGEAHIFHYGAQVLSLSGERLLLRCSNQFNATAHMLWDVEFLYDPATDTWSQMGNIHSLVYEAGMEAKLDGMTANQELTVCTDRDGTETAYTVPKGGVLFFHQVCISGEDVFFQVTNEAGQGGWLKDPEEVFANVDGQDLFGCFEEAVFAG